MIEVTSLDKIGKRGLYSSSMFSGMLPKGRTGKVIIDKTPNGTVTFKLGAKIGTREHMLAVVIVSNFLRDLGKDEIDHYKVNIDDIDVFEDELDHVGNYIMKYTDIVFNLGDLAQQMYGDRKYAKRLRLSFERLEQLLVIYENEKSLLDPRKKAVNISHFKRFSLGKKGMAQIGMSNSMLKTIIPFARTIRLDKILGYNGITAEVALFVEYNQFRGGSGSLPKQTYRLMDMVKFLGWGELLTKERGRVIKTIQSCLDEMDTKDKDFTQYLYDPQHEWFYNKYKKSVEKSLFNAN